ncbi:hypothetical protein SAMN05660706_104162 [Desulfoscipio geothermicus DSM 3669]|uniref:Uncharacterized protein n=1 Tax=Desulfoscipio geothermicus DSM 3669 TaxID=1121426 RepID=A0A1I6D2P2_9FIRM|nr:hypothetical protein SAMN05660706_104162 [Desulfoscipio geothermicus DSM 3669]
MRYLKGVMEKAGVTPTNKEERCLVDRAVREIVGNYGSQIP